MESKKNTKIIILLVALVSLIFWYFGDAFSIWTSTNNPLLVMIVTIILNPAYIFLIYTLYKQYELRGLFAGLLISIGIDVASLTHSIMKIGRLPTDVALYGYSDTTIYKLIIQIMHAGPGAVFVLYFIIPVALVLLSLMIIHKTTSFVKIFKEVI